MKNTRSLNFPEHQKIQNAMLVVFAFLSTFYFLNFKLFNACIDQYLPLEATITPKIIDNFFKKSNQSEKLVSRMKDCNRTWVKIELLIRACAWGSCSGHCPHWDVHTQSTDTLSQEVEGHLCSINININLHSLEV